MRAVTRWCTLAGAAVLCLLFALPVRANNNVDLVLVLALDVSSSVDAREFDIQKTGLVLAFRHTAVIAAIQRGRHKRIAVAAVQWAGYRQQRVMVPWMIVGNRSEAARFSDRLADMPRAYPDGATHLSGVIRFASNLALDAPHVAVRRVIDISGDGKDNVRGTPQQARDLAVAQGVTINGLAIANEAPDLFDYYRTNIIGGPSSFALAVRDYNTYPAAILRKLVREIDTRLLY